MERRRSRSSLGGNSDSETSLFREFQERELKDKELFDTPKGVSGFINEERRKASSPGRNSQGSRSSNNTPTSNKNVDVRVHEGEKDSTPTKVITQADVNPTGLATISEEEIKKKQCLKHKEEDIEMMEFHQDPIGIFLIDTIYYMASFIF